MPIGRTIFQSELMTVLQNVAGVEYVTLNDFSAFDPAHAYGSDPTQIDALYVAPTEIAWPSVSGDESTASVSLSFVGGIADPGGGP